MDLLFSNNHTDSADADEFLSCQDIEDVREDLDHDISQLSSRPNYVPVEFSETYYPLWKAFELHIDNRSFCANQHAVNAEIRRTCSEVTRVIRDIDKHGDLHTIFQTQDIGNVFETQIFSKMIHNIREFGLKRASSCANILRSLLKFLDFVSIHSNQYPTISESAILSVIKRTKQFKLIVEKKKSLRTNQIRLAEPMVLSQCKRKHSLDQLRELFDQSIHPTRVRDYLMAILADLNSARPSAITNMKVTEFQKVYKVDENAALCIQVSQHKTCNTFGSASLFMADHDYTRLKRYVALYRPLPSMSGNQYVFLTTQGQQMKSSQFCRLYRYLLGYTTSQKRKFDCESCRDTPEDNQVAAQMLHSITVHRSNYQQIAGMGERYRGFVRINQSGNVAFNNGESSDNVLTNPIETNDIQSNEADRHLDETSGFFDEGSGNGLANNVLPNPIETNTIQSNEADRHLDETTGLVFDESSENGLANNVLPDPIDTNQGMVDSEEFSQLRRAIINHTLRTWKQSEVDDLIRLFGCYIMQAKDKLITLNEIRCLCRDNNEFERFTPKQIQDQIRRLSKLV